MTVGQLKFYYFEWKDTHGIACAMAYDLEQAYGLIAKEMCWSVESVKSKAINMKVSEEPAGAGVCE